MQKRIFIAINLPENIKSWLLDWRKNWPRLDVRWTKPENLHITLAFIGYIKSGQLEAVIETVEQTAKDFSPFEILLNQIHLGPDPRQARMIWLSGPQNQNLESLSKKIIDGLLNKGIELDTSHAFRLHITLARASSNQLRGKKIQETLNLNFTAESIEIMESHLYKTGAEYRILKKIDFKKS